VPESSLGATGFAVAGRAVALEHLTGFPGGIERRTNGGNAKGRCEEQGANEEEPGRCRDVHGSLLWWGRIARGIISRRADESK
jgi:hypothetical protein